MRRAVLAATTAACLALLLASAPAGASSRSRDLGRQTLPPNDGWASVGSGTTGGSAADAEHVFVVSDRAELVDALGGDNATNGGNATPKVIYVQGVIDANTDDEGNPITCEEYAAPGYTLEDYLAAYDPAVWGRDVDPFGPLEDARDASVDNQVDRIRIRVGSNTTIVGLGRNAVIRGANLFLSTVDNVIIRNIRFEDTYDCFPRWDPNDGELGNWNSQHDSLSVINETTHVWVDHNTFTDGDNPDSSLPVYFGRIFQVHDGQLDVTNGSDFVTASWNRFAGHGKTMLIGSTNTPTRDRGKLSVTVHHNVFDEVQERAPRVRFGKVHVYNNHYVIPGDFGFVYSLGVGVESQIVADNNFFALGTGITADRVIFNWGGTVIDAEGSLVKAGHRVRSVDILAAHNAVNDPDIGDTVDWTPTLYHRIDPTWSVPLVVPLLAGSGRLF